MTEHVDLMRTITLALPDEIPEEEILGLKQHFIALLRSRASVIRREQSQGADPDVSHILDGVKIRARQHALAATSTQQAVLSFSQLENSTFQGGESIGMGRLVPDPHDVPPGRAPVPLEPQGTRTLDTIGTTDPAPPAEEKAGA